MNKNKGDIISAITISVKGLNIKENTDTEIILRFANYKQLWSIMKKRLPEVTPNFFF